MNTCRATEQVERSKRLRDSRNLGYARLVSLDKLMVPHLFEDVHGLLEDVAAAALAAVAEGAEGEAQSARLAREDGRGVVVVAPRGRRR